MLFIIASSVEVLDIGEEVLAGESWTWHCAFEAGVDLSEEGASCAAERVPSNDFDEKANSPVAMRRGLGSIVR